MRSLVRLIRLIVPLHAVSARNASCRQHRSAFSHVRSALRSARVASLPPLRESEFAPQYRRPNTEQKECKEARRGLPSDLAKPARNAVGEAETERPRANPKYPGRPGGWPARGPRSDAGDAFTAELERAKQQQAVGEARRAAGGRYDAPNPSVEPSSFLPDPPSPPDPPSGAAPATVAPACSAFEAVGKVGGGVLGGAAEGLRQAAPGALLGTAPSPVPPPVPIGAPRSARERARLRAEWARCRGPGSVRQPAHCGAVSRAP